MFYFLSVIWILLFGREFGCDLTVKGGKVGFKLLQLIFLAPCLGDNALPALEYPRFILAVRSSCWAIMSGKRSRALTKFIQAAWVSDMAMKPLLYLYL